MEYNYIALDTICFWPELIYNMEANVVLFIGSRVSSAGGRCQQNFADIISLLALLGDNCCWSKSAGTFGRFSSLVNKRKMVAQRKKRGQCFKIFLHPHIISRKNLYKFNWVVLQQYQRWTGGQNSLLFCPVVNLLMRHSYIRYLLVVDY